MTKGSTTISSKISKDQKEWKQSTLLLPHLWYSDYCYYIIWCFHGIDPTIQQQHQCEHHHIATSNSENYTVAEGLSRLWMNSVRWEERNTFLSIRNDHLRLTIATSTIVLTFTHSRGDSDCCSLNITLSISDTTVDRLPENHVVMVIKWNRCNMSQMSCLAHIHDTLTKTAITGWPHGNC